MAEGASNAEVAERTGLHRNTVSRIKHRVEFEPDEDDEPDEPTETADEPETTPADDWGGAVKPALVEALKKNPTGLTVDQLERATGLKRSRVQGGLQNHRGKTFLRSEEGIWTLKHGDATPMPADRQPRTQTPGNLSRDIQANMVAALLRSDQPLSLEDISRTTKIPQSHLFQVLKDEQFERDTDQLYWIKK